MTQTATTEAPPQSPPRPKVRRKVRRIVNVRLLIASALVVLVGGVAGYFWHRHQSNQVAGSLLERATSLEQEEKWPEAVEYLARYLQVAPADTDARLRLIEAVEKSDPPGSANYRLVSLLYQSLGTLPERDDLRLKLAQLLLDRQDFAGAKMQSELLSQSKNGATQIAARRILALSQCASSTGRVG